MSLSKIQNTHTISSGLITKEKSLAAANYLTRKVLAKAILKAHDEYQKALVASLCGFELGEKLKLKPHDADILEGVINRAAQVLSGL